MTLLRRLGLLALVMVLLGAAVAVALGVKIRATLATELDVPPEGIYFVVSPGTPFSRVAAELSSRDLLPAAPHWLSWYARLTGAAAQIQAGEFRIVPGETVRSLLGKFVAGEVYLHAFTIVEGWTFAELLEALHADPTIASSLTRGDEARLLDLLGSEHTHPEGLFLPETYRYPRGATDVELLQQANALLRTTLDEEWLARSQHTPLHSAYEALILASIIEKETALAVERPRIAGVFTRRLERGMRLQTDPTVIYGLGDAFDGNLTRRHLRADTPYNTYTRSGLPPTPIASAGRDAIHAALHPAPGDEVYFVATGLGDGSHKFSVTKAEHDAAVAEYLTRLRNRRQVGE